MTRRTWGLMAAGLLVAVGLAAAGATHGGAAAQSTPKAEEPPAPEHLVPRPDSVGKAPMRFTWSEVKGADAYTVVVWNEVDMLLWRIDDIRGTSVDKPEDLTLDPGTYFWRIVATKGANQYSDSGRAAFVVLNR